MATREEIGQAAADAEHAVLKRIAELAPEVHSEMNGRAVLNLAEAYAWLRSPGQPHGGNSVTKTG